MNPQDKKEESLQPAKGRHENPLPQEISREQKALNEAALRQADKDIAADAELSAHSPNDDLDEGKSARLGEDVPV